MEESKSNVDKLVKAVYVAGGAYFGIELLKLAKSWWDESKAQKNPEKPKEMIKKPRKKSNKFTFGVNPDLPNKQILFSDEEAQEEPPTEIKKLMSMIQEMKGNKIK